MELRTHFKLYSLNHGKLMGSGYVSSGVLLSSVYKIQRHFMSSGPRKPPKIRYSKNRCTNSKDLMNRKRFYKRSQDSENTPIKNELKTAPKVSSINPYNNSTTKSNISKPSGTETKAYLSVINTKDAPVIFTDKRSFLANVEGEPKDSLSSIFFAKTLIPTVTVPENVSPEQSNTQLSNNKTLSVDINQNLSNFTLKSTLCIELEGNNTKKDITVNVAEIPRKVYLKEFYEEKIKEYFSLAQDKKWSLEKQNYLKTMGDILNNFYLENKDIYIKDFRDMEELTHIKNLYGNKSEIWINELLTTLAKDVITSCRTISNYEKEIQRYTEMISILNTEGILLPDPAFHELARRLGVILNNDAIYKDIHGNSIIVKEGEGSTLTRDVYTLFSKKKEIYFTENQIKINTQELNEVFAKITLGDFLVGSFKQNLLLSTKDKFIESGDERHMHLCIKIQKISEEKISENLFFSLGFFTSNKDQGAIKLTNKQYMNDEDTEVKKEQWFRPFNQFLHIKEHDFVPLKKATNYARNKNCENIDIQEILITEIKKKEEKLKANPIREVLYVTKEHIKEIALEKGKISKDILKKDLENMKLKFQNVSEKEKIKLENERENQYKKIKRNMEEAAFYSEAPYEIRELHKIKFLLENEKKKHKCSIKVKAQ
jgi:hypothetical protein